MDEPSGFTEGSPATTSSDDGAREPVNSLWIGSVLPRLQRICIGSFLANGHPFRLFAYEAVEGVPDGVELRDAREILPEADVFVNVVGPGAGSYAAFSDLFRYRMLAELGGWWVDTDLLCLRPFVFDGNAVFASELCAAGVVIVNGVIKVSRGHPVVRHCLERAVGMPAERIVWGEIGPLLLAEAVRDGGARDCVVPPEVFCPVPYWHWKEFRHPDACRVEQWLKPHTFGVHLAHEMWRREQFDFATQPFPETSWLGRWERRLQALGIAMP